MHLQVDYTGMSLNVFRKLIYRVVLEGDVFLWEGFYRELHHEIMSESVLQYVLE